MRHKHTSLHVGGAANLRGGSARPLPALFCSVPAAREGQLPLLMCRVMLHGGTLLAAVPFNGKLEPNLPAACLLQTDATTWQCVPKSQTTNGRCSSEPRGMALFAALCAASCAASRNACWHAVHGICCAAKRCPAFQSILFATKRRPDLHECR